jgi:hypothetical protein
VRAGRRRAAPRHDVARRARAAPASTFGPRADRGAARLPKAPHTPRRLELRAVLRVAYRVTAHAHPRDRGPFAPSPCKARRPRSWTSRPPRQPWARTREVAAPINQVGARWPTGAASHRAP